MDRFIRDPGARAALIALAAGAICLFLTPYLPSVLNTWPKELTVPANSWVGEGLGVFLETIKPAMRLVSALLSYPMEGATWLLSALPWPLVVAAVVALGWFTGGVFMAVLGLAGMGFVVLSGYWVEGMNTLALVFVSVPLALALGLGIGILAYEVPRTKAPIQATLDAMQTIPTFAYLTPLLLLFGFGPVVGLIASAIYAAPPMARNVLLGLERVEHEIKEAAIMSGGTRPQQLFLCELPAAKTQVMVGVNQSLMAALSMVIIAAVIGGFQDIGWEVLLTMRKALFGQAFLAGLVIVVFAILIDRMSGAFAHERRRFDPRISYGIVALGVLASFLPLPQASEFAALDGVAQTVDDAVGEFTAANGAAMDSVKNGAMFFGLLPLRIGLDQAVLPFTWGFTWTVTHSVTLLSLAAVVGFALAWKGRVAQGASLLIAIGILETGITQMPWPFVLVATGALGWLAGGWRLSIFCVGLFALIGIAGLWDRAMLSLYLCSAAVLACAVVGGGLGLMSALSEKVWWVMRPICDMLQTIPLFVFLIPVLMFFQIGEFSAFLAICAYAIVPMIRYTRHGLVTTPDELIEAATASGATQSQILWDVRVPYAVPTILLGLNQTILYGFAMLVIAALIGTTGLGQSIYLALGQADVGLGVTAGAAMAILAFIADRLVQGFAAERRKALGL